MTSTERDLLVTMAALLYATGESHADLAAGIGLDQPGVSRRQSGRTAWGVRDLHYAAAHYGMHVSDLFCGADHAVARLPVNRRAATLGGTQTTLTSEETP